MAYTPIVREMNIQQQGAQNFPYAAGWIDSLLVTTSHKEYDLAAARTAMGLGAQSPLFVIFSCDGGFWANFNANAAIPAGDTVDGSASEYNPTQRYLDSTVTKISVIGAGAQKLSMQFFRP